MLGDAAHLMPPYAGEGVNMAMLDALRLSQYLLSDEFETVHSAIAAYEARMRERALRAAKESLENTELMHSKDAISNMMGMFGG
jgi:2-polyprenyl-6-methoxyphenol hydroxylase-like FAD-dependent oxidoreductase